MKAGRLSGDLPLANAIVYLILVTVPAVLVAAQAAHGAWLSDLGLSWPAETVGYPAAIAALWSCAVGALVGCLLYYNELLLTALLASTQGLRATPLRQGMRNGHPETPRSGAGWLTAFMAISALTALAEEFLWRGFLLFALTRVSGLNLVAAVTVSSILFGVNHISFGTRNVIFKTIDGFVWAALFLGSSSLVAPIVSHLTFQYFVGRGIRRRALRFAGA